MKNKIRNTIQTLILIILYLVINNTQAETNFDHSTTGFQLTGQHSILACEACHVRGIFKGLPDTCEGCHDKFAQIGGSLKPVTHVRTTASCDDCHTDNSWSAIRMDHTEITDTCITCHNGISNTGKPAGHVVSSDTCDDCHLTVAWIPARFDHFGITDTCVTCHNGITAPGKDLNHVDSNDICEDCHNTNAWIPALFDHAGVTDACFSCHNGIKYTGKDTNHVPSDNLCEDCHLTTGWTPATFDHTKTTELCDSCHNGTYADGIPTTGHFNTTQQCDSCHYVTEWFTTKPYTHISPNYPGEHTGVTLTCYSCHKEKSETLGWVSSGYYPDCAACHVNDFANDKHEGLTVSEIPDCSGACHKPDPQHQLFHSDWAL